MMTSTPPKLHHRWFLRGDLRAVLAIERQCFLDSWEEDAFLEIMRVPNVIGRVIEVHGKVVAYFLYELMPFRLNILNMAVDPDWQERGIGSSIIAAMVAKLHPNRRRRLVIDVGERNVPTQLFLSKRGFQCTKILRGADGPDDGYRFVYWIGRDGCARHDAVNKGQARDTDVA